MQERRRRHGRLGGKEQGVARQPGCTGCQCLGFWALHLTWLVSSIDRRLALGSSCRPSHIDLGRHPEGVADALQLAARLAPLQRVAPDGQHVQAVACSGMRGQSISGWADSWITVVGQLWGEAGAWAWWGQTAKTAGHAAPPLAVYATKSLPCSRLPMHLWQYR